MFTREFFKCSLADPTLVNPIERFDFEGATFVTSVKDRAFIQRLPSAKGCQPQGYQFELCAPVVYSVFPSLFVTLCTATG